MNCRLIDWFNRDIGLKREELTTNGQREKIGGGEVIELFTIMIVVIIT